MPATTPTRPRFTVTPFTVTPFTVTKDGVLPDASCADTPASVVPASTQVCEPALDTPFPAYYGLKVLSRFIRPGGTLFSTTSSQSLVQAYSVSAPGGALRVMLVNDDPSNSYTQ
jgi:hypothetical protein